MTAAETNAARANADLAGPNVGMVKGLIIAIAVMTMAIAFIFGAMFGRFSAPAVAPPAGAIDFAAAPVLDVVIPSGAEVLAVDASAERLTIILSAGGEGETRILAAPLSGYDAPVQLRIAPAGSSVGAGGVPRG